MQRMYTGLPRRQDKHTPVHVGGPSCITSKSAVPHVTRCAHLQRDGLVRLCLYLPPPWLGLWEAALTCDCT